jgi:hypothetical protein
VIFIVMALVLLCAPRACFGRDTDVSPVQIHTSLQVRGAQFVADRD